MEDLQKDFVRISQSGACPQLTETETDGCLVIEENTSFGDPMQNEAFEIRSENGVIRILAKGYLGTMWGIYTFSEKILGVDPCYLFNDFPLEKREKLETGEIHIQEQPQGFGFRGAFINDEDLLTGWKDGGGTRFADYPFYGAVVPESVMDMVVETALRLKLNLLIPASLLDIDNPPEKRLADCVAKRGIFLSQHHIEPVGVSAFNFENYCKRYHKKGEFSYIRCPELMEEVWQFYAEKWAAYDNVVWQIGLRGKGDRPVWQDGIPTEEELKQYGIFISRAMARQKEIIQNVTGGKAKYFTSTLWMEGSKLMDEGLLEIPEGTVIVFSDTGPNQMYGLDFHSVQRKKEIPTGIYYHVQYFGDGPHLAPLTGLDKLYYNLDLAYQKGDRAYCILNISNVREFSFEIGAYGEMVWNMAGFSKTRYLNAYTSRFGSFGEEASRLIGEYYDSIAVVKDELAPIYFRVNYHYNYEEKPQGIKNFVIKDGRVFILGKVLMRDFKHIPAADMKKYSDYRDFIAEALPKYAAQCEKWEAMANAAPEPLKNHIKVKWLCHAKTMAALYTWFIHVVEAKEYFEAQQGEEFRQAIDCACEALESLLEYRKCAETGIFENWYRGDTKLNIRLRLLETKSLIGQTLLV